MLRLARAEADAADVTLVPAVVAVVILSVADDARPPHAGRLASDLAEQRVEHRRVGTLARRLHLGDEFLDAQMRRLGLSLGHDPEYPIIDLPQGHGSSAPNDVGRPGEMPKCGCWTSSSRGRSRSVS